MALFDITSPSEISARPARDSDNHDSIDAVDGLPVEDIALGLLSSGFFRRGTGTDPAHVQMLAEVASFSELPPILVQRNNLRIVDGTHRYEAAKKRGERTIRARVIDCTDNDAFILAVKANTLHGLPLSRADRVLGAKRILGWHPDWSDRAIGIATGLSAKTIAGLRRESADDRQQFGKRLGRDGKQARRRVHHDPSGGLAQGNRQGNRRVARDRAGRAVTDAPGPRPAHGRAGQPATGSGGVRAGRGA